MSGALPDVKMPATSTSKAVSIAPADSSAAPDQPPQEPDFTGDRLRSPRVRGGRTADATAVLADSVVRAEAAQSSLAGVQTVAPSFTDGLAALASDTATASQLGRSSVLIDHANLPAYLASAQAFAVAPAPAAALKLEVAPTGCSPSCGEDFSSNAMPAGAGAGATPSSVTSQQVQLACVAQMAQSMAQSIVGGAPGSHTPLQPPAGSTVQVKQTTANQVFDQHLQRALLASQQPHPDFSNLMRMAAAGQLTPELTPELTQLAVASGIGASHAPRGVGSNGATASSAVFANLGAIGSLAGGLTGFDTAGTPNATMAALAEVTQVATMNPALNARHRSASEQLLAELTNSTRAQHRQRFQTHPLTTSVAPSAGDSNGGMDELIDSLFPFTDDMHQQLHQFGAAGAAHLPGPLHASGGALGSLGGFCAVGGVVGASPRAEVRSKSNNGKSKRSSRHASSKSVRAAHNASAHAAGDTGSTAQLGPDTLFVNGLLQMAGSANSSKASGSKTSSTHGDGSDQPTACVEGVCACSSRSHP